MGKLVFFIEGEGGLDVDKRKVTMSFDDTQNSFDMDELTKIRFDNIFGEIVTASALLNRVGLIKAAAANQMRLAELEQKIKYAELFEDYSNSLTIRQEYKTKEGHKVITPTNTAVEQKILVDQVYQVITRKAIKAKLEYDQMDAFYWSVQDKCKKLNNIKNNLKPEDFTSEILEGEVNGFLIKLQK